MSSRFQARKGNTAQNDAFTGAVGELTYDTEKKQLRVHDGDTVGGNSVDDPTRDVTSQVSVATETTAGKAKIATTAIAQAGVNDTDILTAKKLRDALNAGGNAPISACRSWIYFNGATNPPTILSSFNVLSVAQVSSGVWDITFITDMPHANYAVLTSAVAGSGNGGVSKTLGGVSTGGTLKTVNTVRVAYGVNNTSFATHLSVGVFC